MRDLSLPRYYGDKAGASVDARLVAEHRLAVEPLKAYLGRVAGDADRAWRRGAARGGAEAGRCAAAWLAAWSRAGALTGVMATKQAEHQRKWDLAGLALVYLKVRRFAAPEEQEQIEAWLLRLAADARAFFDDAGVKRNNHWYWMGLGLAATSLGTGREPLWQAARQIFEDAMADIAADGTLPHELARGPRALYYHDFAVMPLVALLELAAQRGEDWASGRGKALERLVALTLAGHSDPTVFDRLAGARQERPVRAPAGWVALYAARHPDRVPVPPAGSRAGHRWLGGDVGVLRAALAAARD